MSLVDELREMDGEEATCGWRTSSWNWLDFSGFWLVLSYVQKYNMHLFPKIFSKFYFSRINTKSILLLRVTTVLIDFFFDRGGERSFLRCLSSWKKRGGREQEEKEVNFRAIHAKNAALARVQTRRAFYSRA